MPRIDATALRRDLFETLKHLDEPIEIMRNGRVEAILSPPPPQVDPPAFDPRRLERICQRHKIQRLSVFGSYARGTDFGTTSDVDVLIVLSPGAKETFDRHMDIVFALEDLFGRSVDLCYESTLAECERETRASIDKDTKVLYEAQ